MIRYRPDHDSRRSQNAARNRRSVALSKSCVFESNTANYSPFVKSLLLDWRAAVILVCSLRADTIDRDHRLRIAGATTRRKLSGLPSVSLMVQETHESEHWEKVLWKQHTYPDNYVPRKLFLASLQTNRMCCTCPP